MLRVEKINFGVKDRKLLKDITFQVRKGEVLAVLGANGAGKSTLMGLLCGEKKPDSGRSISTASHCRTTMLSHCPNVGLC